MSAKYEQEVRTMLRNMLFEEWMEESDWNDFEQQILKATGESYESLSDRIEEGIKKGYSLNFQIDISKKIGG